MDKQKTLLEICKEEKEKAQALSESTNDRKERYNANQAVVAWDELAGQLHKPNGPKIHHFEKAKKMALRCVDLMVVGDYKDQTKQKIQTLKF